MAMTRSEAGRLGGLALVQKRGREHMSAIGKVGWQNVLAALAGRQELDVCSPNPFRNLLRNLKAAKK